MVTIKQLYIQYVELFLLKRIYTNFQNKNENNIKMINTLRIMKNAMKNKLK